MHCSRCQMENPAGAKFCIESGTPLQPRCPHCGVEPPAGAKFCAECGTPLTRQSAVASAQLPATGPQSTVTNPQPQTPSTQAEAEAEACFLKAIEIARRQSAKSLELRAVTSLARLWKQQGKQSEARHILAEIYGWFTEGFDTANLQEAKALLAELA